jgi:hypothetical protein
MNLIILLGDSSLATSTTLDREEEGHNFAGREPEADIPVMTNKLCSLEQRSGNMSAAAPQIKLFWEQNMIRGDSLADDRRSSHVL